MRDLNTENSEEPLLQCLERQSPDVVPTLLPFSRFSTAVISLHNTRAKKIIHFLSSIGIDLRSGCSPESIAFPTVTPESPLCLIISRAVSQRFHDTPIGDFLEYDVLTPPRNDFDPSSDIDGTSISISYWSKTTYDDDVKNWTNFSVLHRSKQ